MSYEVRTRRGNNRISVSGLVYEGIHLPQKSRQLFLKTGPFGWTDLRARGPTASAFFPPPRCRSLVQLSFIRQCGSPSLRRVYCRASSSPLSRFSQWLPHFLQQLVTQQFPSPMALPIVGNCLSLVRKENWQEIPSSFGEDMW